MTNERSQAYGRVMATLRDIGPTKLQPAEQDLIREAADTLFFAEDLSTDEAARAAIAEVEALAQRLVEADRWLPETAGELVEDLLACGPASSLVD
jgi:hypothetical protein